LERTGTTLWNRLAFQNVNNLMEKIGKVKMNWEMNYLMTIISVI
jgi:hypothetical protein